MTNQLAYALILTCMLHSSGFSQSLIHSTLTIIDGDSTYTFEILIDRKNKTAENKVYFSFQNQKLLVQQGTSSFNRLHGSFENRSYRTNLLYEKGTFKRGLKHGRFLRWYPDGKLKTVEHYRDGIHYGEFISYNRDGSVIAHKKFRKHKKYKDLLSKEEFDSRKRSGWLIRHRKHGAHDAEAGEKSRN